jgi:hypothetical protein
MSYLLPGVKPHVKIAAEKIGKQFGVKTILGVGARKGDSDHPKGLALDFMIGKDMGKGDRIASHAKANAAGYGITYVIWRQRIWSTDKPTDRAMEDRGSATANHMDHVHVSFAVEPGTGAVQSGSGAGSSLGCLILVCATTASALGYAIQHMIGA